MVGSPLIKIILFQGITRIKKGVLMTLTEYLTAYLGNVATSFDLETGFYTFLVSETLDLYGVDTEAEATDLSKLHKLGIYKLWERLLVKSSASFDFSVNGNSYKTSSLYDFCQKNLSMAYADAVGYLASNTLEITQTKVGYKYEEPTL
jgi:hypothetical protein